MKRRDFIRNVPLAVVPFFSNRLFAEVMPVSMEDYAYFNTFNNDDRVFVVVQMDGGNDGLNMVLPLDQYTNLAAARPNILIPDTSALVLGSFQTGLHPALSGLKNLYDQQKLCVVQGVGYASPNQSHFRSGDVWTSGSDAATVLETGWLGRYLEYNYPGFPSAYPNGTMPDPLSIQIGSSLSRGLMGYSISTGQTVPSNFSGSVTQLQGYANTSVPSTNAGFEAAFLRNQQALANQYATSVVSAWNAGTNSITYPTSPAGVNNSLANQLRIVARLVKGGIKTKVFWVRAGGYDTHANQGGVTGTQANLFTELSEAISAFMTDCTNMTIADRVMGMTFSEFGRRIKSNGSNGTDHGAAGPMFVFGNYVNPTVIGSNAVIPANASSGAFVTPQVEFSTIYQGILQGWFCVPSSATATILGGQVPTIVTNTSCLSAPLPIELLRFVAEKANKKDVHLEWVTATEQSVLSFDVERSTDGKYFTKIDSKKAVGHAHSATRYDILDTNVPHHKGDTFYYRLLVLEEDGNKTLTEIQSVTFESNEKGISADVYPNPSYDTAIHLVLKGSYEAESVTEITVTDSFGRRILETSGDNYAAGQKVDLELSNVANGIYFLSIINANQSYTQKVVLQK